MIANSKVRNNVESWFARGNPIGRGNVVRNNCIKGGVYDRGNGGIGDQWGFRVLDNTRVQPVYADRAARDFRVVGGPCRALLGVAYSTGVPGPDGLHARASRAKHRARAFVFGAVRPKVRRGHRLQLLGRVPGAHRGARVAIFARSPSRRPLSATRTCRCRRRRARRRRAPSAAARAARRERRRGRGAPRARRASWRREPERARRRGAAPRPPEPPAPSAPAPYARGAERRRA